MDTRKLIQIFFIVPVLIISGFQCSDNSSLFENIPDSEFIENCPDEYYEFGETVNIGDPNDRFMIALPYSWDIRESYTDSVYGIFSSNFLSIPQKTEDQMALSVSGYTSEKELQDYFKGELIELVKEDKIIVKEKGNAMLAGKMYPWVHFEMTDGSHNMVYYINNTETNDYYLVQTATYDTVNYRTKFCYLKQLVNSFEIVVK